MLYFLGGPFTGANVDLTNAGVTNDVLTVVSPQQYNFQAGGGGGGGSGTVTSVAAGDGTITIGGTPTVAPTVVVTPGVFDAAGAAAAAAAASVPLSLFTTIGDIAVGTGVSTAARLAAGAQNSTFIGSGAGVAPLWSNNPPIKSQTLTDGATVAVDASVGVLDILTAAGDRTILSPSNAANGRRVLLRITASAADRTMTLTTGSTGAFDLGGFTITATLSGTTDYIDCCYDSTAARWRVVNYVKTVLLWTPANTAIPLSTVTTAGDFVVATGSGAVTRLAVGTAGTVLQSSSSGTIPAWQPNPIAVVVSLTDGAAVAVNSAAGRIQTLVAAGDRTISIPSNASNGRSLIIAHTASGGSRTLALTTGSTGAFEFGTDITGLTITGSGLTDYIGCIYDNTAQRWRVVSYVKGYA